MLNKLFHKSQPALELRFGDGQVVTFNTIADFEFALGGRIAVPSGKIQRLVQCSMQELRAEARTIKEVEKRFVDILSRSIEEPKSINRSLREMDTLIFSQDHHWREIINALNETTDDYDAYRRVALVKYMQYLSARQDIIKHLYSEKKKFQSNGSDKDEGELKDTVILDSTIVSEAPNANGQGDYERLPKGEATLIRLPTGTEMELMLSKHSCRVRSGDNFEFVDDKGKVHKLNKGRNVVGRDALSTVVMDANWRDISRMHVMIEVLGQSQLQITDLSSHGSYVPTAFIEQTSV